MPSAGVAGVMNLASLRSRWWTRFPKFKELGIHWATLDDGWFNNYGDWQPDRPPLPVMPSSRWSRHFHDQGLKVQLWWLPLAVEDGHFAYGGRKYVISDVVKQHPEWLILDAHGQPARMARNLATLCPALPEVQAYYKQIDGAVCPRLGI